MPIVHESAALHVTGQAVYVDDMPLPSNSVHIALGLSHVSHGKLNSIVVDEALLAPGVMAVLSAADIPGQNDCSPVMGDDPIFAENKVMYNGQAVFAVVADSRVAARNAVELVKVDITPLPAVITIEQAIKRRSFLENPMCLTVGEPQAEYDSSLIKIDGELVVGGQEHFYLEGQAAIAQPSKMAALNCLYPHNIPAKSNIK